MIKMPIDRTKAEQCKTNRSSDYLIRDFKWLCVIVVLLISLVVWWFY